MFIWWSDGVADECADAIGDCHRQQSANHVAPQRPTDRTHQHLLDEYRLQAQHLLVDEYQDINEAQFELVSLLSTDNRNGLFVVGDDDQSIYGWRGGSPEFIRRFESDFGPMAKVEPLTHCYRCNESVLEGALSVVRQFDTSRRDKGKLTYEQDSGSKIVVHEVPSNTWEEKEVIRIIEESGSRSVLVLVPSRPFAAGLMSRLHRRGVSFVGPPPAPGEGLWLFDRLATFTESQSDSLALRELIQSMMENPQFDVPSAKVRRADKLQQREAAFGLVAALWTGVIEGHHGHLWASLEASATKEPLLGRLHKACQELLDVSSDDVPELLQRAGKYLRPWSKKEMLFAEIAQWMASTSRGRTSAGQVRVMTLQGAKGLEASVVAVLGPEEGILPRTASSDQALAEESRLMYVAMTRAADELHLFYTRKRPSSISHRSSGKKGQYSPPVRSRFLDAIPASCVQIEPLWR